nr:PmoA family protein [Candidatus Sigynarchaeota archaeon]
MTDLHIVILAGPHDRINCPVTTVLEKNHKLDGIAWFKDEETGAWYPADAWTNDDKKTEIAMVFPELKVNQEIELGLDKNGPADKESLLKKKQVTVAKKSEKEYDIKINEESLTTLHVNDRNRPFLHPFIGPFGDPITRNYPMQIGIPGETKDHPHHTSIWTAYGEVNEVDHWSVEKMAGTQETKSVPVASSGVAVGRIVLLNEWKNKFGEFDITERREMRFFNLPRGHQTIDFTVTLKAVNDDVKFGDTKEGGLLSVRVATSMDGDKGGRIENCYGAIGERECWGKQAPWVDYSGNVKGNRVGFAMLEHPSSFRHPTYWHVRDYGLFSANPFGLKHFTKGKLNGDYTLKKGGSIEFVYRLIAHAGDATTAKIKEKYLDYICSPEIKEI